MELHFPNTQPPHCSAAGLPLVYSYCEWVIKCWLCHFLELCNFGRQTEFFQPSTLTVCFLWMCVCTGVCVYVGVCMCMCVKVRGWSQVLFLRTRFFTGLELSESVRVASCWIQDAFCVCFPGVGITAHPPCLPCVHALSLSHFASPQTF